MGMQTTESDRPYGESDGEDNSPYRIKSQRFSRHGSFTKQSNVEIQQNL